MSAQPIASASQRHRLRTLTVVDAYTREALAIDVNLGIKDEQVVEAMKRIALSRGTS
jgi:putative transposase